MRHQDSFYKCQQDTGTAQRAEYSKDNRIRHCMFESQLGHHHHSTFQQDSPNRNLAELKVGSNQVGISIQMLSLLGIRSRLYKQQDLSFLNQENSRTLHRIRWQ